MATLAETIKEITRKHLDENNGMLLGQAITSVGWCQNTVPDCKNIIELPMCDVAGAGIAVGAATVGRRPILVIRFQDFLWLNGSIIVNYAAKTKDLYGVGTPIFIRAMAAEGKGTGPVHSGKLHSLFMHHPGIKVVAPVTPGEYQEVWRDFMVNDDPMLCCEHRDSLSNTKELAHQMVNKADITLIGVSQARFNIVEAEKILKKDGIRCNVIHLLRLKPLIYPAVTIPALTNSRCGLVVDTGFTTCGAAESIAYDLMYKTGKKVKALGLEDRSVCVNPGNENLTPSPERTAKVAKQVIENE
jgi:pyruvate/2-oxoglutarate/acetoin dehydrogenase E1 component